MPLQEPPAYFAHPTAVVEDGSEIGVGTRVWHHGHIRGGAKIGRDCVLGKNVFVDGDAVIGDRCKVQNNVSVYAGVRIGDDVFLGPSATLTNDLVPRAFNTEWTVTETWIRDGASIGANATIVCGNEIGQYAMVAAGATVTHDVAAHQLVAGTPARHLGWVCRCGTVISRETAVPADLECARCRPAVA
ncbi:MAG: putative acetyltransferase [Acidimicrobiales bacterium]|nr:putative acetyltransferase [Acidimicrobiales bacterium]